MSLLCSSVERATAAAIVVRVLHSPPSASYINVALYLCNKLQSHSAGLKEQNFSKFSEFGSTQALGIAGEQALLYY